MRDDHPEKTEAKDSSDSSGLFKGCILVVIVMGILGVLATTLVVGGLVFTAFMETDGKKVASVPLKEVTIEGEDKAPKLAVIPVEGVIFGSPSPVGSMTPLAVACARLKKARNDPSVRGILLEVDSPGGGITASDILHRRVQKLTGEGEAARNLPVLVHVRDVAASGGYYVAAAADKIWAHPTSITGSIGVIMPMYSAKELMEKIGVENESVVSGPYKDIGSPFAQNTEKEEEAERRILQGIIDQMYNRFMNVVAEGRGMTESEVKDVADGRIFTSNQAKKKKLIDKIGYRADAIRDLKKLAGIKRSAELVFYERVLSFPDLLSSAFGRKSMSIDIAGKIEMQNLGRPLYLWAPGTATSGSSLQNQ